MDHVKKLMKMHYAKDHTFRITKETAQEVFIVLEEIANELEKRLYFPKDTVTDSKSDSTNKKQDDTLKSAMRVTAEEQKKVDSLLNQKYVNELAKRLGVESVCTRVILGKNCNGNCQRSHDKIPTELLFAITEVVKEKVNPKARLTHAYDLWKKSGQQKKKGSEGFVNKEDVVRKLKDDGILAKKSTKSSDKKNGGKKLDSDAVHSVVIMGDDVRLHLHHLSTVVFIFFLLKFMLMNVIHQIRIRF